MHCSIHKSPTGPYLEPDEPTPYLIPSCSNMFAYYYSSKPSLACLSLSFRLSDKNLLSVWPLLNNLRLEAYAARGRENSRVRYATYYVDECDCRELKCRPEVGQGLSIYTCCQKQKARLRDVTWLRMVRHDSAVTAATVILDIVRCRDRHPHTPPSLFHSLVMRFARCTEIWVNRAHCFLVTSLNFLLVVQCDWEFCRFYLIPVCEAFLSAVCAFQRRYLSTNLHGVISHTTAVFCSPLREDLKSRKITFLYLCFI